MKTISVLGSTGSIGTQALEVISLLGLKPRAFVAGKNIKLLEEQARLFNPEMVAVHDEDAAKKLKIALADTSIKVLGGDDGLAEAASVKVDMSIAAINGMSGILPVIAAINAGNNIALANKETLVCAGEIIMGLAKAKNVQILPVDSEHSAIFQCLKDENSHTLEKIILTASGGPFYGMTKQQLENVTPEQALKNPNWKMGKKVTIDSATLMNKGLELIEAMQLYGVKKEQIEILIHRESLIHSATQFSDGTIIAQLAVPDMRLPIQYALTYPKREFSLVKKIDLAEIGKLTFAKPDREAFECLRIAEENADKSPAVRTVMNAANEAAVQMFSEEKIKFTQIADVVSEAIAKNSNVTADNAEQIVNIGKEVYTETLKSR